MSTRCNVCSNGLRRQRTTTITYRRGDVTVVFRGVPAALCNTCGDPLIDSHIRNQLERQGDVVAAAGGITYAVQDFETKYMSVAYLRQSEEETRAEFSRVFAMFEEHMASVLDAMFRLTYFIKEQSPPPPDGVQFFALERCVQLPYSLRAAWLSARDGYYPESAAIVRSMLEAFVQLRYFFRHPQKLVPHFTAQTSKGRIQFRAMFEEFAPGYYDRHYHVLASIAHAGAGLSALSGWQTVADKSGKKLAPAGCEFDRDRASYTVNHVLMLSAGHLRLFPSWFTSYRSSVDSETERMRAASLVFLDGWRRDHRAAFEESRGWHELSDMLMSSTEDSTNDDRSPK